MSTSIIDPFIVFASANKAAVFSGSNYGQMGQRSEWNVPSFEFDTNFLFSDNGTIQVIAANVNVTASNTGGWFIFLLDDGSIFVRYYINSTGTLETVIPTYKASKDVRHELNVKIRSAQDVTITLDGATEVIVANNAINYTTQNYNVSSRSNGALPLLGNVSSHEFYEIDSSFVRQSQLIKLDVNNGNTNTIPNIGTDKPSSSDMTWAPAGSGTYINI